MTTSTQLPSLLRAVDFLVKEMDEVQATVEVKELDYKTGYAMLRVSCDNYGDSKFLFSVSISEKPLQDKKQHRRFNCIRGINNFKTSEPRKAEYFSYASIRVMADRMKSEVIRRYLL